MDYVPTWFINIQQEQLWVWMLNMWCGPNVADVHIVFAMCILFVSPALLEIKDFTAKKY